MKKTLLTVALAALATTAFANTNFYTYQGQDSSAKLYAGASLDYSYSSASTKYNTTKAPTKKSVVSKLKTTVKFGGSVTDANKLTYSFYASAKQSFSYQYEKSLGVKSEQNHERNGFSLSEQYVQVSSPEYGSLTFGNTDTAATSLGDDSNNLQEFAFSAFNAKDSMPNTLRYAFPENLVEGLNAEVSYGLDKASHLDYISQYAANVSYNFMDTDFASTLAYSKHKVNHETAETQMSFDLSATNESLMDGLSLGGEFAYNLEKEAAKTGTKESSYSLGVKASYEVNQYFQPYAGVAYVRSKEVPRTNPTHKSTVESRLGGYLGFNSDLYSYGTFTVKSYLEGSLSRLTTTNKENSVSTKNKESYKEFSLGMKFAF